MITGNTAVLDFGSARLKLNIAKFENEDILYLSFKDETYFSSHVDQYGVVDLEYYHSYFIPKLKEFLNIAKEHNCTTSISIGTHIFRNLSNNEIVLKELENYIGKLNIISSEAEGRLFYYRIEELIDTKDFILLDIGGGSVQIVDKNIAFSIPTGTFSLEKEFQKSKEYATEDEINKMREYIHKNLRSMPKMKGHDNIVFGSSCMKDFIISCFRILCPESDMDMSNFAQICFYQGLFDKLKYIPYKKLSEYYPDNPFFMYGSDKLLLNLLCISEKLNINSIKPTNESLSTSLLNIAHNAPSFMNKLNIKCFRLS
jgi:hypothetical protein